jgi:3-methyladenine DNA glycosylase Tag
LQPSSAKEGTAGLIAFNTIRARAEKRKGGAEALARLLPPKPDPKALMKLRDHRVLAEMTKRVFSAGFAWSVIESKWPGFEEAFLGFEPSRLAFEPDEFWHKLTMDARIVRNGAKIASVRENARFVLDGRRSMAHLASFSPAGRLRTKLGCSRFSPNAAAISAAIAARCC